MRILFKDSIVLRLPAGGTEARVEVRIRIEKRQGRAWEARVHEQGRRLGLDGRVFRDRDRRIAAGKMVRWLLGRFPGASVVTSAEQPEPG